MDALFSPTGAIAVLLISAVAGGFVLWSNSKTPRSQCAAEGEAEVQAFLRAGGEGAFSEFGAFVRLEGAGYSKPVWNIQGYDYISLPRRAHFASNSIPIRIIVRETKNAPVLAKPKLEGRPNPSNEVMIFVSHRGL